MKRLSKGELTVEVARLKMVIESQNNEMAALRNYTVTLGQRHTAKIIIKDEQIGILINVLETLR